MTEQLVTRIELTDAESETFWVVADAGALTTRRMIRQQGPKPNWSGLLKSRHLQEIDTIYGPVVTVGDIGREEVRQEFPDEFTKLAYLTGPSVIANRAYQQDAFEALRLEGYTVYRHDYKRASPLVMGQGDRDRPWTHQIISTCLRVPETEARILALRWGQRVKRSEEIIGVEADEHRLGYPYLYATISGGGLSKQRVGSLYQQAKSLSSEWRTPMMIVVPDLSQHRDVLRRVEAEQAANKRSDQVSKPLTHYGSYPVLRLIEQPLPRTVTRKSR